MFLQREKRPIFHGSNLPWKVHRDLASVVFGQVISLIFLPGDPTFCLLELLLLERHQVHENLAPPIAIPATAQRIEISFYDLENQPDFIIPYCRYEWSVQPSQRYDAGEIVRVLFGRDEAYEARIKRVKVSSEQIPTRPWQCYVIEWLTLDDKPEPLSPWELETIFEEDVPERRAYLCEEYIDAEISRLLEEGLKRLIADPRAAPFKKAVDLRHFPDYLDAVAYPMDLSLLLNRVINGYYRRLEAFGWDAGLIYENAQAYNTTDSEIVNDAEYVVKEIRRLTKRAERGSRRVSRHVESDHDSPPQPTRVTRSAQQREERARRRASLHQVTLPSTSVDRGRSLRNRTIPDTVSTPDDIRHQRRRPPPQTPTERITRRGDASPGRRSSRETSTKRNRITTSDEADFETPRRKSPRKRSYSINYDDEPGPSTRSRRA